MQGVGLRDEVRSRTLLASPRKLHCQQRFNLIDSSHGMPDAGAAGRHSLPPHLLVLENEIPPKIVDFMFTITD